MYIPKFRVDTYEANVILSGETLCTQSLDITHLVRG